MDISYGTEHLWAHNYAGIAFAPARQGKFRTSRSLVLRLGALVVKAAVDVCTAQNQSRGDESLVSKSVG